MTNTRNLICKIHCITNMHVGSGDADYGVIENMVQRDSITGVPMIYGSSLKGALREFFKHKKFEEIEAVFGSEPDENDEKKKNIPGSYKFFSAHLLSLPVRSNKKPFFRAVAPMVIKDFLSICENLGFKPENKDKYENILKLEPAKNTCMIFEKIEDCRIEDYTAVCDTSDVGFMKEIFGEDIALFSDDDFKDLCRHLPVIARNCLENGISKNLWYEEIVPRETFFYFPLQTAEHEEEFLKVLKSGNIQIGGNATIGYGYTEIKEIAGGENEQKN